MKRKTINKLINKLSKHINNIDKPYGVFFVDEISETEYKDKDGNIYSSLDDKRLKKYEIIIIDGIYRYLKWKEENIISSNVNN